MGKQGKGLITMLTYRPDMVQAMYSWLTATTIYTMQGKIA